MFLASDDIIDWRSPAILACGARLGAAEADKLAYARRCFDFVRDEIRHSWDYRQNPVTCAASQVLAHSTGYCYAKSHLLAALLRAGNLPAGLCYQRLRLDDGRFCLHGLNAVKLPNHGWYRMDARGVTPDGAAEFCPPLERLAFPIIHAGEVDLPGIWAAPLPVVVQTLRTCRTCLEVYENLPDCAELPGGYAADWRR
ncbi:MAG: Transglutaminase-like superfamily protein [Deltaproteobacteria bacterium ADurb.Bin510]|nr:MAG: Transglutaminase-like superfamily protein [Deltaproteobacteria bacterium ADurb.Bin510]